VNEITAIMIHVPDPQAALAWYGTAFPAARPADLDKVEALQLGELLIEFVPADEKVSAGCAGSVIYWRCNDLEKTRDTFITLGARLYRGPMDIENGQRMCQVLDPWGNIIGLRGSVPVRGRILDALRRSPLVGANLDLTRLP
jgi:predicted enzyme related to lactoylglutathione lyase